MKRKILHVCTGFSLDFNGGITNYVRCLAAAQQNSGYDVYVLCDDGCSDGYTIIKYCSKIKKWSFGKKKDSRSLKRLEEIIEQLDFSLIHIHMMLNIDQRLYQILKGKKYVISLHDYYFICPRIQMIPPEEDRCEIANTAKCTKCLSMLETNWYLRGVSKRILGPHATYKFPLKSKRTYKTWINNNKKLLEGASMLFPVSKRVEEIYKNSGIENKYKVLHIGNICADNFVRKSIFSQSATINLIILSSVSRMKGGPLFFSILNKVKNPNLKVHFYGRANKEEQLKLQQLGIIDHGPYKQTELPEILRNMDMGVMTPIWEDNGPQVVMEMLNNYVPVFGTKIGGIPDFVTNKNGFLFDPYNELEINEACRFLNELNRDQINFFRSNIEHTTTTEEHLAELSTCYDEVLNLSQDR